MKRLAGIELGGTKVVAVLGEGTIIVERVQHPLGSPGETLGALSDLLARWHAAAPLDALGIASFGPISLDPARADYGRLLRTAKPGWTGIDVVGPLRRAFAGPLALHTDVTAAALAEGRFGAAQGCDDFAFMTVGTGGRRYRGGRAYVALAVDSGGRVRGAQVLRGWTTFAKAKPLTAVVGQRVNKVAGDSPIAGLDKTAREACREAATLFLSARQEWREGGVTTT